MQNGKHQSRKQPEHHNNFAVAKVEMRQRTDIESYHSTHTAKHDTPGVVVFPGSKQLA
jgi:hypothetical protein